MKRLSTILLTSIFFSFLMVGCEKKLPFNESHYSYPGMIWEVNGVKMVYEPVEKSELPLWLQNYYDNTNYIARIITTTFHGKKHYILECYYKGHVYGKEIYDEDGNRIYEDTIWSEGEDWLLIFSV